MQKLVLNIVNITLLHFFVKNGEETENRYKIDSIRL